MGRNIDSHHATFIVKQRQRNPFTRVSLSLERVSKSYKMMEQSCSEHAPIVLWVLVTKWALGILLLCVYCHSGHFPMIPNIDISPSLAKTENLHVSGCVALDVMTRENRGKEEDEITWH